MKIRRLTASQRAELIGDLHTYGGAAVLAIGAGMWYPPAGVMLIGGFLAWLGLFWRGRS